MRRNLPIILVLGAAILCLFAALAYNLPPVHDRLAWRVENLRVSILYALNPPAAVVFVPEENKPEADQLELIESIVNATLTALLPTTTPTPPPGLTPTATHPNPTATPTPTPEPTPIPGAVTLSGAVHEYQQMNNCGPTTLAMALSYWGWQGDQRDTRAYLRPNFDKFDDKNVMPEEMVTYVETHTALRALGRFGGDLTMLKRLVAAGFPVIVEKGLQPPKEDWMGHFALITGYDDERQRFITQDSYVMSDYPVPYTEIADKWWRDFNYAYIVVFPPEREGEVLAILGPHTDLTYNRQIAADLARTETTTLLGRDLYFAWFNLGSNMAALGEHEAAAQAYDQAFAVYAVLPQNERPWRNLWYQVGPYEAYYHTGRYEDLISLGNATLSTVINPVLEESFYWLGRAREATGDLEKAIADYQRAVEINPNSTPAILELERLGVP